MLRKISTSESRFNIYLLGEKSVRLLLFLKKCTYRYLTYCGYCDWDLKSVSTITLYHKTKYILKLIEQFITLLK